MRQINNPHLDLNEGQLLAVVSKDSNNQMFPVAWAVVENKNKNT